MLSRIGESLYWMARNLERADNTARILDINLVHMLEADEGVTEEAMWMPLLQTSTPISTMPSIMRMASSPYSGSSISNSTAEQANPR